jgi:hypothetical protein
MAFALPVNVTCPVCQNAFRTEVYNVIDVGQDPELKTQFLQGQLNVATCPSCGQGGMLAMPLVYHDPDKELLLVFIPDQVNMDMQVEEREKLIGDLVNTVIESIPPEQRRGYLLQPQTFFSMERMMEEILKADGVTPEMIEAQREALNLMQELLLAKEDEEHLAELVEEHREALDYEFFLLLSGAIEAAKQADDTEQVQDLNDLRAKLVQLVTPSIPEPLAPDATHNELLEALQEAEDEEALRGIVISNRPMIDYAFFQRLTERIESMEAESAEEAAKLQRIREQVLEITDELDQLAQEAQEQRLSVIEELVESDDLDQAIEENAASYDTLFFMLLTTLMAQAREEENEERLARLEEIQRQVGAFIEENLPPELRLLSQLMAAEYPEETRSVLDENSEMITDDFVQLLHAVLENWKEDDQARESEVEKLQQVIDQVEQVDADEE